MLRISPQRIVTGRNRLFALAIHHALSIFFPYRFFPVKYLHKQKNIPLSEIKRILIIRLDGLGDMVMSTPAFKGIRKIFPDAHITLLTFMGSKELAETIATFDRILYYDAFWMKWDQRQRLSHLFHIVSQLRSDKYDLSIDLRGDLRNNIFMYLCAARYRLGFDITGCGYLLTHISPIGKSHHPIDAGVSLVNYIQPSTIDSSYFGLTVNPTEQSWAVSFMREKGIVYGKDTIVLVHPGAKWKGRHWFPERYAEVSDYLVRNYNVKIILTGSKDDTQQIKQINDSMRQGHVDVAGELSLKQFIALMSKCDIFLGVDSGPMHMAAALEGVRVVALLGPALPDAIGPYGDDQIVVTKQEDFSCCPCAQNVCERIGYSCMDAITVEDVIAAVVRQIKNLPPKK